MKFGYFTLSDNHYPGNRRTANEFVMEIRDQAVYADKIGMHSAWIGEHHFDRLGVNSRPGTVLANVAALTENIRLAPAITVLPIHHPVHVAEEWATLDLLSGGRVDFAAGRGYDHEEYQPFGADFFKSAEMFDEGIDVVLKAWTEPGEWSHKGTYYNIEGMAITPKPVQQPIPFYIASFSKISLEMAGRRGLNVIFAPFAAAMVFGGLDKGVDFYREACVSHGHKPGRAMCSYFIHIAETPEEDETGRQAMMDYYQYSALRNIPDDPAKMPPNMRYFLDIREKLAVATKESMNDRSILIGTPAQIIESLKKAEAAGMDEIILYFNIGRKPHSMVIEQMDRFMRDIAPAFDDAVSVGAKTAAG